MRCPDCKSELSKKRTSGNRFGARKSCINYLCENKNCPVISVRVHYERGVKNKRIAEKRVIRDSIMSRELK